MRASGSGSIQFTLPTPSFLTLTFNVLLVWFFWLPVLTGWRRSLVVIVMSVIVLFLVKAFQYRGTFSGAIVLLFRIGG